MTTGLVICWGACNIFTSPVNSQFVVRRPRHTTADKQCCLWLGARSCIQEAEAFAVKWLCAGMHMTPESHGRLGRRVRRQVARLRKQRNR